MFWSIFYQFFERNKAPKTSREELKLFSEKTKPKKLPSFIEYVYFLNDTVVLILCWLLTFNTTTSYRDELQLANRDYNYVYV